MKVTIYYTDDVSRDDPDMFDVYTGVESVVMHQSGCIHLSSERDLLTRDISWHSADDWTWAEWESDDGLSVLIHNASEL